MARKLSRSQFATKKGYDNYRRFMKKNSGKTTYGKPFRKKNSRGKFKKGTWIRYKYVNGRRVGSVKSRK